MCFSEQTGSLQILLRQKIVLEPSKEGEHGSSSYFHTSASHHELQSSYPESFPPHPPESNPSNKASLNVHSSSVGFSDQAPPFPSRQGVGDRFIQSENEIHYDVDLKEDGSMNAKDKDCGDSCKFEEVPDITASLIPHCKMKFSMVNSGSLPTLFPSSHPVQVPSDKKNLHSPCFKPSTFSEWPTAAQQGAYCVVTPASLSPLSHCPPDPLQTANRYLRANSHENLPYSQEEFVSGSSLKPEMIITKGLVWSLAEQFQQLQGVSQKEGTHENKRKVTVCCDQRVPKSKLPQESFSNPPSLGYRQPVTENQKNGMWPAEQFNLCLGFGDELSSVDCFSAHNIISKKSGSHKEELCNRGKQHFVDPDFHPGMLNKEGDMRQVNDRNPAGLVASVPVDHWVDNVKRYYSSQLDCKNTNWVHMPGNELPLSNQRAFEEDPIQNHPQWNQDTEQELSELEPLYQASLQAPQISQSLLGRLDGSWHPLDKMGKLYCKF